MQVLDYGRTIRRWALLILLFTVLAGGTAAAISFELPATYQVTTVALVNPAQVVLPSTDLITIDQLVQTYVELIDSTPVRNKLVAAGVPRTAAQLAGELKAQRRTGTTLIDITVRDHDPHVTYQIGGDILAEFNGSLDQLQSAVSLPRATGTRLEALVPWDVPAAAPTFPVSPNIPLNTGFGLAAGLVLGFAFAFLLEYLDNTIKAEHEIRLRLDLELLGMVALKKLSRSQQRRGPGIALVTVNSPKDAMTEMYKAIRTNVYFALQDKKIRSLVVTSTIPAEGKTSSACNLAVVLAQAGRRVILVDADFRRPALHKIFQIPNIGLSNLIAHDLPENEILRESVIPRLCVVPTGPTPANPSELLGSPRMGQVIELLENSADVVIFDTPPVGAVTDATVLASRAGGGVILVVERGRASVPAIIRARDALAGVKSEIVGVILNKVRNSEADSYYYYYYEYQGLSTGKNGRRIDVKPEILEGLPIAAAGNGGQPLPRPLAWGPSPGTATTKPSPPSPPEPLTAPPAAPTAATPPPRKQTLTVAEPESPSLEDPEGRGA